MGDMIRPVDPMDISSLSNIVCYKIISLLRSNLEWKNINVNDIPLVVKMAKDLRAGKANPHPEYISIPIL